MLISGKSGITDIPEDRWDKEALFSTELKEKGKIASKKGGFIDHLRTFDASFFGISPQECECMDPQQRLALELAWEAFEDAGMRKAEIKGSNTGVYIGASGQDFSSLIWKYPMDHPYVGTGTSNSIIANRISYFFDFQGPSMTIDTACSSALVATLNACQSIWNGTSRLALAGGVNAILLPEISMNFSRAGLITSSEEIKAFDESSDGYLRSEGGGLMVLKPYDQALEDGDHIYACIRGGAFSHNGKSNGLSAPNPKAEERLLTCAYDHAGITDLSQIAYIEAQGIGTRMADSIEVKAINGFLQKDESMGTSTCAVGSVKPNIGHLESASGMASLIKVALSMKNGRIPATINIKKENAAFAAPKSKATVQKESADWPSDAPIAGVSAFGFGGANAHLVLEKTDPVNTSHLPGEQPLLLKLSAKSQVALELQAAKHANWLSTYEVDLVDYACWMNQTRTDFDHRLVLLFRDKSHLISLLNDFVSGKHRDTNYKARKVRNVKHRVIQEKGIPIPGSVNARTSDQELQSKSVFEKALNGIEIDWQGYFGRPVLNKVNAPTYAFNRSVHWPQELQAAKPDESVTANYIRAIYDSGKFSEEQLIWLQALLSPERQHAYSEQTVAKPEVASQLRSALPEDRQKVMHDYVTGQVMKVMKVDKSEVSAGSSLVALGLDSLMAYRLRDCLYEDLNVDVDTVVFLAEVDISSIVDTVLSQWEADPQEYKADEHSSNLLITDEASILDDLDDLSPEEVNQLISHLGITDQ